MRKQGDIRFIVALSTGLLAGSLVAQTPSEDRTNTTAQSTTDSSGVKANDTVQVSDQGTEQQTQYAAALNGTGLISLDSTTPTHLLFGTTLSGGWDSNPDNLANAPSSGTYTLSPYLGIQATTPKTQYLIQYQAMINGYSSSSYSQETMNMASAAVIGSVNERWNWEFRGNGSYGQDSLRLLSPQQNVAVGQVPGADPNSASYIPNAGKVTFADAGLDVHYRKSAQDTIEFHVGNSFSHFSGLNDNNGFATTGRFDYGRELSPNFGVMVYGQGSHINGSIDCTSVGGGIGLEWQPRERTTLSLSGGPQIDMSACGSQLEFSYNAAFSTRLSEGSQIYLLASRQPTASYLGPELWQVSFAGGYQKRVNGTGSLSFDLGYTGSDTSATVTASHGTYFDCSYRNRFSHGFSTSYSYRGYIGDWGGDKFTRNVALFSLAWSPGSGRVFQ
jgi:hypothetical protein